MKLRIFSAILAIVAASLAFGVSNAQVPDFQPVALTQENAQRALNAMPDVYEVARKYENEVPRGTGDDMIGGLSGLATYAAARADFSAVATAHGFSGYEDWASVFQTIMHTYAYTKSAGAMQQMAPMMDQAMQQILSNPNIPQAQKDAILAQMGGTNSAMAGLQANQPSAENQAIVSALEPEIERLVGDMRSNN